MQIRKCCCLVFLLVFLRNRSSRSIARVLSVCQTLVPLETMAKWLTMSVVIEEGNASQPTVNHRHRSLHHKRNPLYYYRIYVTYIENLAASPKADDIMLRRDTRAPHSLSPFCFLA